MAVPRKSHVLMIPLGFAGHINIFKRLLYHLARCNDVAVTVMTSANVLSIFSTLQSKGEFGNLDLRLVEVFGDVPLYPDPRFPVRAGLVLTTLAKHFQPFKQQLIAEKNLVGSPTCMIVDMYLWFTQELAAELEIPWFPFYSSSASFGLCCMYSPTLIAMGQHPERKNQHLELLGLEFCRYGDLVGNDIFESPESFIKQSQCVTKATAILMNSAEELEGQCGIFDAIRTFLSTQSKHQKVPSVITVGPIVKIPGFSAPDNIFEPVASKCLEWLDTQHESSVLYICFGTVLTRSEASMRELAHALLTSKVPFLWVLILAEGDDISNALPPDFESKTAGWGFIEKSWAPQVQVLRHPSTGGFMTHCGWNSSLEALCTGVPVITWPHAFDQHINARFLIDVAQIGVPLEITEDEFQRRLDVNAAHVERAGVERSVRLLMLEDKGKDLRRNAQEMKKVLEGSIADGGSSHRNMEKFISQILLHP